MKIKVDRYYPLTYMRHGTNTVNSTMENHRQWRITRKDIAEFLET